MTESWKLRLEYLLKATSENTKSKALDRAAEFYLQMRDDTAAVPNGVFVELVEKAEQQGSVIPEEIAAVLDTEELPVVVQTNWLVGQTNG